MSPKKISDFSRKKPSGSILPVAAVAATFLATGIFVWAQSGREHGTVDLQPVKNPVAEIGRGAKTDLGASRNISPQSSASTSASSQSESASRQAGEEAGHGNSEIRQPRETGRVSGISVVEHFGTESPIAEYANTVASDEVSRNDGFQSSPDSNFNEVNPEPVLQLAALGPVESIAIREDGAKEISILGQRFIDSGLVSSVAVGEYVFAASTHDKALDFFVPIGEEYLQGVSEIRVLGAVDAIQPEIAQFSIGDTSFDYTYLLSDAPEFALVPGEMVEITGNQHVAGGSILLGIHGSGIRTSSLQGIHGSGIGTSILQGIHGSGIGTSILQGIHGSGIGTSSLQGIHGSGIGTSILQGIHGSGIGTSSLQGIHGSGIGTSSLQGIHGSGISQ